MPMASLSPVLAVMWRRSTPLRRRSEMTGESRSERARWCTIMRNTLWVIESLHCNCLFACVRVINGSKLWITNAGVSDWLFVLAVTDKGESAGRR